MARTRKTSAAENFTKTKLIEALSEASGYQKSDVKIIIDVMPLVVAKALKKHGKVSIPHVVILRKKSVPSRPARMGRNPATGEPIKIPAKRAHTKVVARPAKTLKDTV